MDENEINDIGDQLEPGSPRRSTRESEGVPWGAILLLIWAVFLIIFSVQNAERATVEFLGWSFDMPIALLVMVTALATLVLTGLGFWIYRRRRLRRRAMARAPESEA
ncbi:MAG: lipopolysaccharide assembly protein LapA domain-containing protein [Acidimicrobiia bacterium]